MSCPEGMKMFIIPGTEFLPPRWNSYTLLVFSLYALWKHISEEGVLWCYKASLRKRAAISRQAANYSGFAGWKNFFCVSLNSTGLNQLSKLQWFFSEKISGCLFPISPQVFLKCTWKLWRQRIMNFLFIFFRYDKVVLLVLWNKLRVRILSNIKMPFKEKLKLLCKFLKHVSRCHPHPASLSNSWYNAGFALGLPRECFPTSDLPIVPHFYCFQISFVPFAKGTFPITFLKRQIPKPLLSLGKTMVSYPFKRCLLYDGS